MAKSRICTIESCGKTALTRGWCSAHYSRWKRYGDPMDGGPTPGDALRWLENVALPFNGDECLSWPFSRTSNGYGKVNLDGRLTVVSRLVCERVYGLPPTPQHQAAHSCGKGHEGCCNPTHLRWATRAENEADKLIHGTINRGERNGYSKLTKDQVREIRALDGTNWAIAEKFGVSHQHVSLIKSRKTWTWVE